MTGTALARYDAMCRAIAEAKAVDEVREIRDRAEAMRHYARQAKNRQLEIDCAEVRMRAERRVGELMEAQRETVGLAAGAKGNPGGRGAKIVRVADGPAQPTLAEAGIDKHLADRARKMAAIPGDEFEGIVSDWRDRVSRENERVTVNLLRAATRAERQAEKDAKHMAAASSAGRKVTDLQTLVQRGEKFGCIYADPPWVYDNQGTRAATGNHYDGLTVDELCALPVRDLAADDAHLHLWTTNGFIFDCPQIFDAWGFEFRSSFVWVKPQMGIGNYWRNSHEFLLTAIRGKAKRFNDHGIMSWLECDRGRHSAKPEQVRGFIERASPGPFLEMFARTGAPGWTVFGNQLPDTLLCHDMEVVA